MKFVLLRPRSWWLRPHSIWVHRRADLTVRSMWETGRAAPTPTTSRDPSHCAAGARYSSGIFFPVMIDVTGGWSLGFMHEDWRLGAGAGLPPDADLRRPAAPSMFTVSRSRTLRFASRCHRFQRFIAQFRKARAMTAYTQGQLFQFNLDQTAPAAARRGELRRQDEAIWCGERRGFFNCSRGQAGGRCRATGAEPASLTRRSINRYRLSDQHQRTASLPTWPG